LQQQDRKRLSAAVYGRELRRSRVVRIMRKALPVIAVMALLVMVGRSAMLSYLQSNSVSIAGAAIEDGRLVMQNPRMGGFNAQKRPYEMSAERAIQTIADTSFVDLENISAKLPVGNADWASVEAATGTMTKSDNTLRITSPTLVKTTDGMVARLKSAKLDMGRGDLTSDEAVEIDTDTMRVTADSMTITEGGEVMVFEKRVKVVMERQPVDTASAGSRNANN
jgi:lipopolysaccharide export system protein LptC